MKKVLLILLLFVVVLLLISMLLPSRVKITRSAHIDADARIVFDQVNQLPNWKNWSYWDRIDPNMKSRYEGASGGTGSIHKWTSEHDQVGNGSITITESDEPSSVKYALKFGDMPVSNGGFDIISDTSGGVIASMFIEIDLPIYTRIFGLFFDRMMGPDFEASLKNMKSYCESHPAKAAAQSWKIESITTDSAFIMSKRVTASMPQFQKVFGATCAEILSTMETQGLKQINPVFAYYHQWAKDKVDMEPCIPVDKPGKSTDKVKYSLVPPVEALKIDYFGDYAGSEKAHQFLNDWIKKNNRVISGSPWEEYVTDPTTEPDTSKWLTRIYYPVQ